MTQKQKLLTIFTVLLGTAFVWEFYRLTTREGAIRWSQLISVTLPVLTGISLYRGLLPTVRILASIILLQGIDRLVVLIAFSDPFTSLGLRTANGLLAVSLGFAGLCITLPGYAELYVQVPINCGGARVNPGDVLFGDEEGVLVGTFKEFAEIVTLAEEIQKKEHDALARMGSGESLVSMLNLKEHLYNSVETQSLCHDVRIIHRV